jgi:hypothetical protein
MFTAASPDRMIFVVSRRPPLLDLRRRTKAKAPAAKRTRSGDIVPHYSFNTIHVQWPIAHSRPDSV